MNSRARSVFRILLRPFPVLAAIALFTFAPFVPAQTVWSNALYFDGVDDFVQAADVPLADSSFTLEVWARRHAAEGMDFILGQGWGANSTGLHFGFHYGSIFVFGFYYNDLFSAEAYTDDDWHHWAGTYDADTKLRCLYRDGTLIASNTASANYQGSGAMVIGKAPCSADSEFHGEVDEVRVWNVARTSGQIRQDLSHPLTGLEANLVAYWRFDEAESPIAHDSSTNAYDGTLVNDPAWTNSTIPTLVVTNLSDSGAGSLRQAISDAASGTIIFLTNTGTLTLTSGQLTISNSLSIVGPGATKLAISGNNNSRVFDITSGGDVSICGLTIHDGQAANGGTGVAGASGGGIYNAGTLTLNDCVITNNRAGNGGAGYAGGTGASGGAGGAGGHGGGIYSGGGGALQIDRCSISGNFSGTGGAGGNGGRGYDSTSTGGYGGNGGPGGVGGGGAGLYSAGLLVMTCSTLSANTNRSGGAGGRGGDGGDNTQLIHLHWGGNGGHGADGGAGGSGGALYAAGPTALSDSTISGNGSGGGGTGGTGGTGGHGSSQGYWGSGGDGGAGGVGGGIGCGGPDISLERCTLVYNSAGSGGILGPHGSAAPSSSYTNGVNGAVGVGGGICSSNAPVQIVNTVLALNTRPVGTADDVYGAVESMGHNLVGNTNGSTGFGVTGDLLNLDPLLGPLADNGGPTPTHAPLFNSPIIDAGDKSGAPATDQRGCPRIMGNGMDIGALEMEHLPYALAGLTLSPGTLSPAFYSETTNYSALVGIAVPDTTVIPVSQDLGATIRVGMAGGPYSVVASGTPSSPLSLAAGMNLIEVQVTAYDSIGTWTYTVAVTRDVQAPTIDTCPSNRTLAAGTNCQAPVPDLTGDVVAHDDLTAANELIISQSPAAGSLVGSGTSVVTMTVQDAATNATTCDVTITVADQTPPVIAAPTSLVLAAAPGQCAAPLAVTVTVSDNCDAAPVLTLMPPLDTLLPVGRTNVVATATDAANNASTCTIDVAVLPGTNVPAGVIWIPRESTRNWRGVASSADGSKLVAVVDYGDIYTSTDSGTNWTARMTGNWRAVASSADGTRLVAVMQGYGIYTSVDSGTNWTARMTDAYRSWNCVASSADGMKLAAGIELGQLYISTDAGTNWIPRVSNHYWYSIASSADGSKLVAADFLGNGGSPYLGYLYRSADSGATWSTLGSAGLGRWRAVASSTDGTKLVAAYWGGQIYTSVNSGTTWTARASAHNWMSVASSADGTKLIAVEDGAGNGGQIYTSADSGVTWTPHAPTQVWRSVTSSQDGSKLVAVAYQGQIWTSGPTLIPLTNAPTILGATNRVVEATGLAGTVLTLGVAATNTCQPDVAVTCTPPSGSLFPLGTTTVACVAVDSVGMSNTATFTVTVRDTTPPVLACPADQVIVLDPGQCETTVSFSPPTATDLCDPAPVVTCSLPSGSMLPVGQTNVLCAAMDFSNNASTCSFTIIVYPAVTNLPTILGATNQVVEAATPGLSPTAYDATPNGLDGALVNGPVRIGSTLPFGGYTLAFDGVDDYVSVPGGINLSNSSFTIEAWARRDTSGGLDIIATIGELAQRQGVIFGFGDYDQFAFSFWENGLYTTAAYTDKGWHHWAGTFDAATQQRCIYRDGTLVASDTAPANYTGTGPLRIGCFFSGEYPFGGTIDEVRIWTLARTQGEIQDTMNRSLAGTEPGLAAYYRFDEAAVVTFSVTATNTCQPNVPVTYVPPSGSWFPLGTNTVTCMAVDAVGVTNTASFTVEVRDSRPPAIVAEPASQTVSPGTDVILCVTATGGVPISYQWRKDGTNLFDDGRVSGASSACLAITNAVEEDSGEYSVALTNAYGDTTSSNVTLWVSALDHFAWSTIASPQAVGSPFPVTLTALDELGNPDTHFAGTVSLSGSVEGGQGTNSILGAATHWGGSSLPEGYEYTLGYAFTPNTNLTVTHVRHYFGSKVSIWTDTGTLLATRNVASVPGMWLETPLPPLQLTNGVRYRVGVYLASTNYYYRFDMAGTFPNGTIDASYNGLGDAFPTDGDDGFRWWFVDLRYTVGWPVAVAVAPTQSLNFVNGVWSGDITVLEPVSNLVLMAAHSAGPRGMSNPFDVLPPQPVLAGWAVAGPGRFQLQASGSAGIAYTLQTSTNLVDWMDHTNLVADPNGLIDWMEEMDTNAPTCFYRLRWP